MARSQGLGDASRYLGEGLRARLPSMPAGLRGLVDRLLAPRAATRIAGLDGVHAQLLPDGALADDAHETLPYLVALATAPRYPEAARLLVRLSSFLSAIDDPPRRLAGAGGTEGARRAYDVIGAQRGALLRVARSSTDPEAARIAATIVARYPEADGEVTPLLVALMSGTRDPDERARLLYMLARVQASAGAPFQVRVAEALESAETTPEKLAVSMALAEHDPPEPLRGRVARTLREAAAAPSAMRDPTTWGDRLSQRRIRRLLERLGAGDAAR